MAIRTPHLGIEVGIIIKEPQLQDLLIEIPNLILLGVLIGIGGHVEELQPVDEEEPCLLYQIDQGWFDIAA